MFRPLLVVPLILAIGCSAAPATPPAPKPPALEVAVTVDDLPVHGPSYPVIDRLAIADRLLGAFRAHRLPPVYGFVNGKKVDDDPASLVILRHWIDAGNLLGNHTYSHASLNDTPIPAYLADVE